MTADGRLEFNSSTQAPHGVRDALAVFLGLEPGQVHVVTPDVGGGFGAKASVYPEESSSAGARSGSGVPCAGPRHARRACSDSATAAPRCSTCEIGGSRDGTVQAYRIDVLQDCGAYPGFGAVLPFMTRTMASGPTRSPRPSARASRS